MAPTAHNDEHQGHHTSMWLPLGFAAAAGAVIAAPYVLPAIGLGDSVNAQMAIDIFHSHGGGAGSGLAGWITSGLGKIPGIGGTLAAGGWASIAATAGIGIGGMLLANWLEKREGTHTHGIRWSKVIRYASLITSALIALPSILTGLSIGIAFLTTLFTSNFTVVNGVIQTLSDTIGGASMSGMASGGGLLAMAASHLLTCGAALFPLVGAFFLNRKAEKTKSSEAPPVLFGSSAESTYGSPANPGPTATLVSADPVAPGRPCRLFFQLTGEDGRPLAPEQLDTRYEHKLHTMVVDSALTDYHHLHPIYDAATGMYRCEFTPRFSTPYTAWNDFSPRGAEAIHSKSNIPGLTPARAPQLHPAPTGTAGNVQARVSANPPLSAEKDSILTVDLRGADDRPIGDLEPIMGAYAHLAGFSGDGKRFLHCHPLGTEPPADGRLRFHITPEAAGSTRFFLQIRHRGQEIAIPFDQRIAPPEKFTVREAVRPPATAHAVAA